MKPTIWMSFAIAAGIAVSASATAQATATPDAAMHNAAVSAARARLATARIAAVTPGAHAKAMGQYVYPGTPMANPFRAYPPSCAAYPLPDKASGPASGLFSTRLPLYTRDSNGTAQPPETVTITLWRIACSSTGAHTPYNTDGGHNAMTLMRIDRDAANDNHTDIFPTFPLLQVKQGSVGYSDAASIARAAAEPNTVLSDGVFDAPIYSSTTYALENFNYGAAYNHLYSYAFNLLITPFAVGVNPVEFQIPDYSPFQTTYPDAFNPLPIDGYMGVAWYDPAHGGEGMFAQVIDNADGATRTFFAAWFTYDPNGLPFWITAQGTFNIGATSVNATGYYQTGGGFAGNFGASTSQHIWGALTFNFPDCATMKFSYNGQTDAQTNGPSGTGNRTWKRLADNNGLSCE